MSRQTVRVTGFWGRNPAALTSTSAATLSGSVIARRAAAYPPTELPTGRSLRRGLALAGELVKLARTAARGNRQPGSAGYGGVPGQAHELSEREHRRMVKHGEVTVTIDRPIEVVFDFLADGENDKKFSKRIIEIAKITDGPVGVGTVYRSKARDLGRTASHDNEITAFERPRILRWRETSKGPVVVADGGYALRDVDGSTELTFHGDLEGHGPGKLILGFVSKRVRAGFPAFARSIKDAIETDA